MNEYSIDIHKTCGKNVVTRDDGKVVHDLIVAQWVDTSRINIDFGHVLVASVSFFDEIFGQLAFEYSRQDLTSKIHVQNIQEFDRALLNDILKSRFRQKELQEGATAC